MATETGEKEFYRKKAERNKETIKTWYIMHENSKLLDQLSEIQKDIASIKKIIRLLEKKSSSDSKELGPL